MSVKEICSADEFQAALKEAGDKLVVVDFHAQWCGPCKMIAPKIVKMAQEHDGEIVFLKVDVDDVDELAASCQVEAMPTFQFYKNGEKKETLVGANEAKLKDLITKLK